MMLTLSWIYLILAHVSLVGAVDAMFITPGRERFVSTWMVLMFVLTFVSVAFFVMHYK